MTSLSSFRVVLLIASVAAFAAGCGETPKESPAAVPARFKSTDGISDAELRRVRQEANQLLDGGEQAFRRRIAVLKGTPVVVNQWASWCGPCRYEFPFFQRQALKYGARVAFLGVDSRDSRDEAQGFLREFPTPFPHFYDPDLDIARTFKGGRAWPTTAFYAASGELAYTHVGAYRDEAQLEDEIRKYALDG